MSKKDINQNSTASVTLGRRKAMKRLAWAAPAVVATAVLKARAQDGSSSVPGDGDGGGCPPP